MLQVLQLVRLEGMLPAIVAIRPSRAWPKLLWSLPQLDPNNARERTLNKMAKSYIYSNPSYTNFPRFQRGCRSQCNQSHRSVFQPTRRQAQLESKLCPAKPTAARSLTPKQPKARDESGVHRMCGATNCKQIENRPTHACGQALVPQHVRIMTKTWLYILEFVNKLTLHSHFINRQA